MTHLIDVDVILSENEEWTRLEEEWGTPIDLDIDDEDTPQKLTPVFSTLDLCKTTFDSSFILKTVRKKVERQLSKKSTASVLDYKEFLQDLKDDENEGLPLKPFYFINGQILSAFSVEEICDKIDDIFKSIEKLSSATSTFRQKRKLPSIVHCSISTTDLSFDDTIYEEICNEKEKSDMDDIDKYIDEAFNDLNSTIISLASPMAAGNQSEEITVTTLVRKFSNIVNNPKIRSPRKKRQCCDKFRELANFWENRAFESEV